MKGLGAFNEVGIAVLDAAQADVKLDINIDVSETDTSTQRPALTRPTKGERKNHKSPLPAYGKFNKVKGSNPQEVRRQFLAHQMLDSPLPSTITSTNAKSSGKLRTGREVLNRMKFDAKFDTDDFVVGYIDRKEGIVEKSVEEWEVFGQGQEELMAYVKDVRLGGNGIVWDRARRIDLVFSSC